MLRLDMAGPADDLVVRKLGDPPPPPLGRDLGGNQRWHESMAGDS